MPTKTKGNAPAGSITILVRPYQGRYIAICKETGVVREAQTFEQAKRAIFSSTIALLKEFKQDEGLQACFEVGLSIPMAAFFYWSCFLFLCLQMTTRIKNTLIMQETARQFSGMLLAHG